MRRQKARTTEVGLSDLKDSEYLDSDKVRSDPWFQRAKKAETAEDLAKSIIDRITHPLTNGPSLDVSQQGWGGEWNDDFNDDEKEIQIVLDMAYAGELEWDLIEEAMSLIMTDINSKPNYGATFPTLENVFYFIASTGVASTSEALFEWLKKNGRMLTSSILIEKDMFLAGVKAYGQCQKEEEGSKEFWKTLWDMNDPTLNEDAFIGMRNSESSPETILKEIPKLVARNLCNAPSLLNSIWTGFEKENAKMVDKFICNGLIADESWAGRAINLSAVNMTLARKQALLERFKQAMQ